MSINDFNETVTSTILGTGSETSKRDEEGINSVSENINTKTMTELARTQSNKVCLFYTGADGCVIESETKNTILTEGN